MSTPAPKAITVAITFWDARTPRYAATADDLTSARGESTWTMHFRRDDWDVSVVTHSRLTLRRTELLRGRHARRLGSGSPCVLPHLERNGAAVPDVTAVRRSFCPGLHCRARPSG
ncbi:hypothetical protein GCM10010348_72080 [Streptomyces anthocyanicus]|nr:hypothetical protein GCM10010348_72080 [Streptomyces anthocyanicus]